MRLTSRRPRALQERAPTPRVISEMAARSQPDDAGALGDVVMRGGGDGLCRPSTPAEKRDFYRAAQQHFGKSPPENTANAEKIFGSHATPVPPIDLDTLETVISGPASNGRIRETGHAQDLKIHVQQKTATELVMQAVIDAANNSANDIEKAAEAAVAEAAKLQVQAFELASMMREHAGVLAGRLATFGELMKGLHVSFNAERAKVADFGKPASAGYQG